MYCLSRFRCSCNYCLFWSDFASDFVSSAFQFLSFDISISFSMFCFLNSSSVASYCYRLFFSLVILLFIAILISLELSSYRLTPVPFIWSRQDWLRPCFIMASTVYSKKLWFLKSKLRTTWNCCSEGTCLAASGSSLTEWKPIEDLFVRSRFTYCYF